MTDGFVRRDDWRHDAFAAWVVYAIVVTLLLLFSATAPGLLPAPHELATEGYGQVAEYAAKPAEK